MATYADPVLQFIGLYSAQGLVNAMIQENVPKANVVNEVDFVKLTLYIKAGTNAANETTIANAAQSFDWVPTGPGPHSSALVAGPLGTGTIGSAGYLPPWDIQILQV